MARCSPVEPEIDPSTLARDASGIEWVEAGGFGTYSRWNGYKLDISKYSCVSSYITNTFTYIGGSQWQSAAGNIYYDESSHWDITYYNCGGC